MHNKFLSAILLFSACQFANAQPLKLDWVVEDSTYAPSSLEYDRIATDPAGNVYLFVPGVPTASDQSSSILTQKFSPAGELLWDAKLESEYGNKFVDFEFGTDGSVIVGGRSYAPPMIFGNRALLASYDPETGGEIWQTFIFDMVDLNVNLYDIDLDDNGDILAFGRYNDDLEYDSTRAFVAKISHTSGETIWAHLLPTVFQLLEGNYKDGRIQATGSSKFPPLDYYILEIDSTGTILDDAHMPSENFYPGVFSTFFFFDNDGYLITFGDDKIFKWEIDSIPVWSFDFSRGLPSTRGRTNTAVSDEAGNIYATGYLYDSLTANYMTQTIKLSPEGELVWATVKDFDALSNSEGGRRMAVSGHHVFVSGRIGDYLTNGDPTDNYQIALYSQEDGVIIYDTLIDGNVRDVPYYAHYGNGHFYLLGRSYIDFSTDPDDYLYKLYSFSADEPVSVVEEGVISPAPVVFPNPTMGTFHISQPGNIQFDKLVLYDGQGKSVLTRNIIANHQEFNLPDLPDGVYLLQLHGEGAAHTARLVVASPR